MTRVDRIFHEAQELDASERSELVERLLESMPLEIDSNVEDAWKVEVRAQLARFRSGEAELIPFEDFKRQILAR